MCLCAGNLTLAELQLGSNIMVLNWAPQADILGHPSIKAFVTQGGVNSLYEAMHNAVPVALLPVLADQPYNLKQASCLLMWALPAGLTVFRVLGPDIVVPHRHHIP